ncbi:MAG: transglutaminase domain-containing protein, partial [Vallitaleaceae bacterium]|nr:transglutaminase domain-containing protein [Vallitaleaceae bacterium]
MIALFLLCFSFLLILSGSFSYELNLLELFGIAVAAYLFHELILNRKKVLFWTVWLTFIGGALGIALVLYYQLTEVILEPLRNFFADYYYSMVVESYYIDQLRQGVFLFVLGILLFKLMYFIHKKEKISFLNPLIVFSFTVPAYLVGSLGTSFDKAAFLFYCFVAMLYIFELRFRQLKESGLGKKMAFYRVSFILFLGVFLMAFALQKQFPNPFMERIVEVAPSGSGAEYDPEVEEAREKLEKFITENDEYRVSPTFDFDGIELFRVNAQKVKYYRLQTYDQFEKGRWMDTIEEEAIGLPDMGMIQGEQLPEDFYQESVDISYKRIYTDLLITPISYQEIISEQGDLEYIIGHDDTISLKKMFGEGTSYTIQALLPKYGTKAFTQRVLDAYASGNYDQLSNYDKYLSVDREYDDLVDFGKELVREYNNPYDQAVFLTRYLQQNYAYSINPEYESDDYVREFIFEKKEGFCQQFASSLTLMLRGLGIPSRFVVGYVVNVEPDIDDSFAAEMMYRGGLDPWNQDKAVYDSNAHAWVEIYVPEFGWIQLEPTPGQSIFQFSDPYEFETREWNELSLEEIAKKEKQSKDLRQWIYWISIGSLVIILFL